MNSLLNRMGTQPSTNKSGGAVAYGAVVIAGSATAKSFTTTTTEGYKDSLIGVVVEPAGIADNATGLVSWGLWAPRVNLDASAALYDFIKTDGVAGQGTPHAAPMEEGDFALALETGTTPSVLLFGAPSQGGGGGGRELIDSASPSGTGTVTFSSIPDTFTTLEVEFIARSTLAGNTTDGMSIRLNNDSTAGNYRRLNHYGFGTNTAAADGNDDSSFTNIPAADSPSGSASVAKISIPFYAQTTFNKQVMGREINRRDTSSVQEIVTHFGMEWENTVAINRLDLILASGNYVSGSEVRLYGVS